MRRIVFIILASGFVLYVIPLALVFIFQRSFMYFPPSVYMTPEAVNLPAAQEVFLDDDNGADLTAWWLPPKTDGSKTVMFFHGNGSAVFSNHDIYRDLHSAGYGVLGVSYPGYPGATGKPKQKAIINAVDRQYNWLLGQGIDPSQIIFFGTSLGSGIAAQLATRHEPSLLIMDAPFNSTLDIGRLSMPIFPVGLFMKDTYRSDLALKSLTVPFVWTHGTKDDVIPLAQGRQLYDSYQGPKTHLIIEGGQHTNLWRNGAREFVMAAIAAQP